MSQSYGSPLDESRVDRAYDAQQLDHDRAMDRARAPISYQLLFVIDGDEHVETFECTAHERAAYVRQQFGISLDNVPFALRSKDANSRWTKPIGDKTLCASMSRMR